MLVPSATEMSPWLEAQDFLNGLISVRIWEHWGYTDHLRGIERSWANWPKGAWTDIPSAELICNGFVFRCVQG